MKLPTSSVPPSGPVRCPAVVEQLDYEAELVVVLGADDEIAGYAVADDVSARDLQSTRAAVDAGQGRRHVLPLGPVDHDRRRRARTPRRCASRAT